jgi:hypothetical protein
MQKFEDLPPVDKKGLRSFGLTMGIVIAGLFGLFFPWVFERAWPLWPFVVGGIFAVWGLALPMTLKRVYNGWMRFGLALSRITTPIIMGIVFYLLFTPMAIVLKLLGKDFMARKLDEAQDSYRVVQTREPSNLENPF